MPALHLEREPSYLQVKPRFSARSLTERRQLHRVTTVPLPPRLLDRPVELDRRMHQAKLQAQDVVSSKQPVNRKRSRIRRNSSPHCILHRQGHEEKLLVNLTEELQLRQNQLRTGLIASLPRPGARRCAAAASSAAALPHWPTRACRPPCVPAAAGGGRFVRAGGGATASATPGGVPARSVTAATGGGRGDGGGAPGPSPWRQRCLHWVRRRRRPRRRRRRAGGDRVGGGGGWPSPAARPRLPAPVVGRRCRARLRRRACVGGAPAGGGGAAWRRRSRCRRCRRCG